MKTQILTGLVLTFALTSAFAKTAVIGDVVQKGEYVVLGGTVSCSAYSMSDALPVDLTTQANAEYKMLVQVDRGFTVMGSLDGQSFDISGDQESGSVTFNLSDANEPTNRIRTSGDFTRRGVVTLQMSKNGRTISLACVKHP